MQKVSSQLAPSKEAMANVNEAGPQDEFITEGGRRVGTEETPIVEGRVPGTDVRVKAHPREEGATMTGADGEERDVGEVRDTVREETGKAKEGVISAAMNDDGIRDPVRAGIDNTDTDRLETTARGITGDEPVDQTREAGQEMRNQREELLDENVRGEQKKMGLMDRMRGMR
ncbi:hypothetical protein C0991_012543, partial [Blastosporella zonata]